MERTGKIVLWTSLGVGVIGGEAWVLTRKARARSSTLVTKPATPHLTATELLWPAPASFGTIAGQTAIGPASNAIGPNGVYQLATVFTAPVAGSYTLTVAADDCAQITVDGQVVGVINISQGLVTFHITLAVGPHVLLITVANNDLGQSVLVPYGSDSPNPTGAAVQLTTPTGTILIAPGHPTGWHYSGYLTSLQVTTTTPLTTSTVFA